MQDTDGITFHSTELPKLALEEALCDLEYASGGHETDIYTELEEAAEHADEVWRKLARGFEELGNLGESLQAFYDKYRKTLDEYTEDPVNDYGNIGSNVTYVIEEIERTFAERMKK